MKTMGPPVETQESSPLRCSRKLLMQLSDGTLLTLVVIFQSGVLNFFIVRHFRDSIAPYFWFVADLLCVLLFAATLTVAYKDVKGKRTERDKQYDARRRQDLLTQLPVSARLGSLPFSYGSWLFYSALLVAKIVLIFKADIPAYLKQDEFFGPQTLKISIALSAIVLVLLVEGHHDEDSSSLRNGYISSVCMAACLDVMDSVSFLGILFVHETHLVYSFAFENIILGFSCLNILLPALTLYKLSLSGFGRTYNAPVVAFYKFLHLVLVNVPYMGVRIYLWSFFHSDISVFLVKNIWASLILLRSILPEIPCRRTRVAVKDSAPPPSNVHRSNGTAMELQPISGVSTVSGSNNHSAAAQGDNGISSLAAEKTQASSAC